MDAALTAVAAALADLDDDQLRALIAAVNGRPQAAPRLLAWIEHIADWEFSRRRGFDYPLQRSRPKARRALSVIIATHLRLFFAEDGGAVAALFEAIVALLSGRTQHQ